MNGSFAHTDPNDCSPNDSDQSRACSLQANNQVGFYEASSWEYSWSAGLMMDIQTFLCYVCRFAPHDTAHLVKIMGGNVSLYVKSSWVVSHSTVIGSICGQTWTLLQCRHINWPALRQALTCSNCRLVIMTVAMSPRFRRQLDITMQTILRNLSTASETSSSQISTSVRHLYHSFVDDRHSYRHDQLLKVSLAMMTKPRWLVFLLSTCWVFTPVRESPVGLTSGNRTNLLHSPFHDAIPGSFALHTEVHHS